jgi:Endonuclease/Exonuclease/phosphatase family
MAAHLRILTYNTQLRSWMMEVGFPPSIPPVDTAEERAKIIAAKIISSPLDYDIVCLNEVFDEDAREILASDLRTKYPYQVAKADLLYTKLVRPGLLHDLQNAIFAATFGPLLDVTSSILAMKWEDSGLLLASKWPFDTVGVPPEVADMLGPEVGAIFPLGVPIVSFLTYSDCSGLLGDCRAAKGVLHARFRRSNHDIYDVFASHTQADDDHVDENRVARDNQMSDVWDFIKTRTGGPPFARPTFFLGDLNILGGAAENAEQPAQWKDLFNTVGSPFTDRMVDLWGSFQCRGGDTGLNDPGFTADVRYQPLRQRLDYAIASAPSLVCQHIKVDYSLAEPPVPPIDGVSFVSDHLPLSIDLAGPHPFAAPPQAMPVAAIEFHDATRGLQPSQVMWYRFDQQGTYEFRLDAADPEAYFEIYIGSDLSRPRNPYRNESHPDFGQRFVLVAPFFVKVGNRNRDREFGFRFHSHRHEGRDPFDPINLIPGVPYPELFPDAQQLNGDHFLTPWDDTDTKWFLLDTPRVHVDRKVRLRVDVTLDAGPGPISILVAFWDAPNPPVLVDETHRDVGHHSLEWDARPGDRFFVCVRRRDGTFAGLRFTVTVDTDLTLVLGGNRGLPRLVCTDETSGWGADDISVELRADEAGWSRNISNDEIGDFEQDSVRDLRQWIPTSVPYQDGFMVKVIEEDDIDSDDVGQETIPPYKLVSGWSRWTRIDSPTAEGNLEGAVSIDVDDGTYTLRCVLSRWDETR